MTIAPFPAPINVYWEGEAVVVATYNPATGQGGFYSVTGAPIDPATVQLLFRVNNGATVGTWTTWTYGGAGSIIKTAVGQYYANLDTTGKPGTWQYKWFCPPGVGQALAVGNFQVNTPPT